VPAQSGPYFVDVTDEAGLTGIPAFRVAVADLDGDGWQDVFIHLEPNHASEDVLDKQLLFLNRPGALPGQRTFVDVTDASGIRANRQGDGTGRHSDAAIFADVDNDGDLDVFTNVYVHRNDTLDLGHNDLLLNDGTATFTLAPNSPFHRAPIYNTAAEVFLDYDNDGNVDLFIGNWYDAATSAMTVDRLYRGHGDGSFTDVTVAAGLGSRTTSVYAVAASDWNDDGRVDLFAPSYAWTVLNAVSVHWRNNGDGTVTEVQASTNYDDHRGTLSGVASFGSMFRDYDNDGDSDFVEILTHGTGDGAGSVHSTAVTNQAGVFSWDFDRVTGRAAEDPDLTHHGDHHVGWLDVDNDGLVDFVITESGYDNNHIYLFRQGSDHVFRADTPASGLDAINQANLPAGHVVPLDYDNDGDEDLLVSFGSGVPLQLWRNEVGNASHWLKVRLVGAGPPDGANRAAIGAKVEVEAGGTTWTREVNAGNGHQGPQVPLELHFGIGAASTVDAVRVRWPNATLSTTEILGVAADGVLTVEEAGCLVPGDPDGLRMTLDGSAVVLTWNDPGDPTLRWNVYRDASPDPSGWGAPYAEDVVDEDPATPGVQYTDPAPGAGSQHYLVTASSGCGESPLR